MDLIGGENMNGAMQLLAVSQSIQAFIAPKVELDLTTRLRDANLLFTIQELREADACITELTELIDNLSVGTGVSRYRLGDRDDISVFEVAHYDSPDHMLWILYNLKKKSDRERVPYRNAWNQAVRSYNTLEDRTTEALRILGIP